MKLVSPIFSKLRVQLPPCFFFEMPCIVCSATKYKHVYSKDIPKYVIITLIAIKFENNMREHESLELPDQYRNIILNTDYNHHVITPSKILKIAAKTASLSIRRQRSPIKRWQLWMR